MSDDHLKAIADDLNVLMSDVNAIRNGDYDAPMGTNRDPRNPAATMDDIYARLEGMTSLMETQNEHLYRIAAGIEALQGDM